MKLYTPAKLQLILSYKSFNKTWQKFNEPLKEVILEYYFKKQPSSGVQACFHVPLKPGNDSHFSCQKEVVP